MQACGGCSDFIQCGVSVAHIHTLIHTVCDSMMYSLPPTLLLSFPLPLYMCVCSATNLLSTEHTHRSGEENTAILSHPSVILSLYPSFSTPMLFVSALLSSSLLFSSLCYVFPPSLSFIPHHSLFSIMSVPTGRFLSFFFLCFSLSYSPLSFI